MMKNSYSKKVEGVKDFAEALNKFGLNFEVNRVNLFTNKGGFKRVPQKEAIIRTDSGDCLGLVSGKYPIISPKEKFGVFSEFANDGILEFVDGGTFGKFNGKVYLQARIAGSLNIEAEKGEIVEKRITFISSYDGTKANELLVTPYRLVCSNGLAVPEKALTSFKYRNTKNVESKLSEAAIIIENAVNEYRNLDEIFMRMMNSKPFSQKQIENFSEIIIPKSGEEDSTRTENRRKLLIETIQNGVGQDIIDSNNIWKLFNGATCFVNNVEAEKKKDAFDYVYFGTGNDLNERAFNTCLELVEGTLSI